MAVEAQLCPQCGAAVQFAVGQTEVVCSHCGTTVVKAAAASVEKELQAEKLVQETEAQLRRLRAHGRPATGKLVSAQATDIFRRTIEGAAVLMALALDVQPDGEPPFAAQSRVLVQLSAVAKYQPGTLLNVRFDPQDRAQVAIEGRRGSDGNTVKTPEQQREERAKKRQAKEQAERKAKNAQSAGPARPAQPAAGTPAWGGPQPHGPPPAPAGFEPVTSLGPAASVHEHQGIKILPNFGTPHATVVVRYHDGLAYRAGGNAVRAWRWDEVAEIQSNLTRHQEAGQHGGGSWTDHEYTLTSRGGEKVILDDGLKAIEDLARLIKQAVFALSEPRLAQRYQAGEALTFGPLTVQRQNGLQLDGKPYAWDAIQDIQVDEGRFRLALRDGKKHEAAVSSIPNIEVLCRLIGLKLDEWNLPRLGWL